MLGKLIPLVNLAPDIVEGIMDDPPRLDIPLEEDFLPSASRGLERARKFLGLPVKDYAAG